MALVESLKLAYAQSPENEELFALLIANLLDAGQTKEAYEILKKQYKKVCNGETSRLTAAKVCLAESDADFAFELIENLTSPEALLLKSKCFLALQRPQDSLQAYQQAVKENPTLENLALRGQINAQLSNANQKTSSASNVIKLAHRASQGENKVSSWEDEVSAAKISFADVGGLSEVKEQIHKKIILPFLKPSIFERFKKKSGGGVLLYGPPGCGKTLLARATAGECNAKFYNLQLTDILDMYIGESERKLHELFEVARSHKPAVIFIDEIEAIAGKRKDSSSNHSTQLVSQFLAELDGFSQNNEGILILGATNTPWNIDQAFRRPGRFDRVLFVAPPDFEARQSIIRLLLAHRPADTSIDTALYAKKTQGFSGADLSNLIETACDHAIEDSLVKNEEVPISSKHIEQSFKEVRSTVNEWLSTARNYAKYANESGQYNDVLAFIEKFGKK